LIGLLTDLKQHDTATPSRVVDRALSHLNGRNDHKCDAAAKESESLDDNQSLDDDWD
jgi:hypothetical protein